MSATQTIVREQYELQTPSTATSRTFDSPVPTPADSTTHLADCKNKRDSSRSRDQESGDELSASEDGPREGAAEVAPEGGYGWVIVAICSLAK